MAWSPELVWVAVLLDFDGGVRDRVDMVLPGTVVGGGGGPQGALSKQFVPHPHWIPEAVVGAAEIGLGLGQFRHPGH